MSTEDELRHARILQAFRQSGATIEDLARAWASLEGMRDEFDAERGSPAADASHGHYLGYLHDAEEILERAIRAALERSARHSQLRWWPSRAPRRS